MRIGMNPSKRFPAAAVPNDVTVVTVTYIPELSNFWTQSLDVLKVCLGSLLNNTRRDFDLMVFDNNSCEEVKSYLLDLHQRGAIQYLILSDRNVGKVGAMNVMFQGAPGRYIAYTDSDVLFYPGWLDESIRIFETFESVGMVSGRPWHPIDQLDIELHEANLSLASDIPGVEIKQGDLIPSAVLREHADSIGGEVPSLNDLGHLDARMTKNGVSAIGFGSHFQFVTTKDAVQAIGPLDVSTMGLGTGVRMWDDRIRDLKLLRLALERPLVRHMGNALDGENPDILRKLTGSNIPIRKHPPRKASSLLTRLFFAAARIPVLYKLLRGIQTRMYEALHIRRDSVPRRALHPDE